MPFIDGRVDVYEDIKDPMSWILQAPITYQCRDETFLVPIGFLTDFASVPTAFTWLIPRYGAYTKAAILHDFLCDTAPVSRREADGIFRRAMRELGVPVLRRWMMSAAVRLAGRLSEATPRRVLGSSLVALPSLVFIEVPGIVVLIFLGFFWAAAEVAYAISRWRGEPQSNPPTLLWRPKTPAGPDHPQP